MSSRQVKWLREQLNKNKKKTEEEEIDEKDLIETQPSKINDLSLLKDEEEDAIELPKAPEPPKITPPPPKSKKQKKKQEVDLDDEFAALAAQLEVKKAEAAEAQKNITFPMEKLNLARELKTILGTNAYDDFLKIPKAASALRFIGKKKYYPTPFPNFFTLKDIGNDEFTVHYTELGDSQASVFHALQRLNDMPGILELAPTMPMCPLLIPILCQNLLFQREFEKATDIAMRGLYVIQQSLPANFPAGKAKLMPSPARKDFLDLIAFLARFAFRRCCFETSMYLWRFGLSLTEDDPGSFMLSAAVPALYAKDRAYIKEMLESDLTWRGIPLANIPDWVFAAAILELPDDILPLSQAIAKFPFVFAETLGQPSEFEAPPLLASVGEAFVRRTKKLFDGQAMEGMLETAAMLATEMDEADFQAITMSYWLDVDSTDVEVADFVEEMVLPTG